MHSSRHSLLYDGKDHRGFSIDSSISYIFIRIKVNMQEYQRILFQNQTQNCTNDASKQLWLQDGPRMDSRIPYIVFVSCIRKITVKKSRNN